MKPRAGIYPGAGRRLAALATAARAAHAAGDLALCWRLCRQHDELALQALRRCSDGGRT